MRKLVLPEPMMMPARNRMAWMLPVFSFRISPVSIGLMRCSLAVPRNSEFVVSPENPSRFGVKKNWPEGRPGFCEAKIGDPDARRLSGIHSCGISRIVPAFCLTEQGDD